MKRLGRALKCPKCKGKNTYRWGNRQYLNKLVVRRHCRDCGYNWERQIPSVKVESCDD